MLTFLTAFLGLVVGVHPVELTVGSDVATVELRLDGETLGTLRGEPWVLACDFGSELAPHELVAIGRDAEGREIARAVQWINLPQPRSQAELVLDEAVDGVARQARLVWHSADAATPDAWRVSFNGEVLGVADPRVFELPAYDPARFHVLQAALRFGNSYAYEEIVLGGPRGDSVDTELTALPVRIDGKLPNASEMEGWFLKDGRSLEVVTVERGGADIVLVQEATPRLWGDLLRLHKDAMARSRGRDVLTRKLSSGLNHEDSLRILLPVGDSNAKATLDQFFISHDFSTIEDGPSSSGVVNRRISSPRARGILATLPYPGEGPLRDDAPRRVADAVAVAGQVASAGRRKRVVVLIKDEGTHDHSAHSPTQVRRYLERLQVPLLVWSPEKPKSDDWGEVFDISTSRELLRGVLQLRQTLDDQVIIWLRGRHLPQDVELAPAAAGRLRRIDADGANLPPQLGSEIEQWVADTSIDDAAENQPSKSGKPILKESDPTMAEAKPRKIAESLTDAIETVVDTVDVRRVNVDVIVTDKDGVRRRDLSRQDFVVYEDGQKVDILHFVPPTDVAPEATFAAGAVSQEDVEPGELPRLVIFFDFLRLESSDRKRLAQALRDVLADAPPMRTMIVTYNRTMEVQLPFTAEPLTSAGVLEEIERVQPARVGGPDDRAWMANELADVQKELAAAHDTRDIQRAEARRLGAMAQLNQITQTLTAEIRDTVAAMRQLTASLGGVDGRKILLYVGDNLELAPARELIEEAELTVAKENEISRLRSAGGSLEVRKDFDRLLREANANSVTFYGVTPRNRASRGVAERSSYGRTVGTGPAGFQGRLPSARQELVKEAVCRLSIESGGLCQSGGTEPRRLLRETVDDLGGTYSLAYAPEHPADGEFHRLKVEVLRPGLKVRHRPGYVDKTAETRLHDRLAATLYFGDSEDDLGITVTAGDMNPPDAASDRRQTLVPLEVRVPVERLGLVPLQGGEKLGVKARLLVKTQNADGGVSGVQEYPISFQVRGERLAAEPPLAYAHKLHLLLEPGSYQVAIGLWDEIGQVGSFLSHDVAVE